jgi:hypothetical protein
MTKLEYLKHCTSPAVFVFAISFPHEFQQLVIAVLISVKFLDSVPLVLYKATQVFDDDRMEISKLTPFPLSSFFQSPFHTSSIDMGYRFTQHQVCWYRAFNQESETSHRLKSLDILNLLFLHMCGRRF